MVETAPHPEVIPAPGGLMWRRSWRRRHATEPEAHQELVVLTGITGSAAYLVDGIVHDIRPGTVVWALAGQQHFLLSESPDFDMWVALVSSRILTRTPDMPPQRLSDVSARRRRRAHCRPRHVTCCTRLLSRKRHPQRHRQRLPGCVYGWRRHGRIGSLPRMMPAVISIRL